MRATITIEMNHPRFDDNNGLELGIILSRLASRICNNVKLDAGEHKTLYNSSGDAVGTFTVSE